MKLRSAYDFRLRSPIYFSRNIVLDWGLELSVLVAMIFLAVITWSFITQVVFQLFRDHEYWKGIFAACWCCALIFLGKMGFDLFKESIEQHIGTYLTSPLQIWFILMGTTVAMKKDIPEGWFSWLKEFAPRHQWILHYDKEGRRCITFLRKKDATMFKLACF